MEISYHTIRDLLPASEGTPRTPTDVREFFAIADVSSVRHAGRPIVRDLAVRALDSRIIVSLQKTLTISARGSRSTENMRLPVAIASSRFSLGRATTKRIVSTVIDLRTPLPAARANSLDIRALAPIFTEHIYPDIYRLPPPFSLRAVRAIRHSADVAFRASWRIVSVAMICIGLVGFLLFFVKSEIESGYDTLIAARGASSLSSVYDSVSQAHSSFARAKVLFAPVALFSAVLPHQVALAANAADGGYALTDALQRLIVLADDFQKQWGDALFSLVDPNKKDDTDESGFSITAYLSRVEPELRSIHAELAESLLSYRAIGSTGDASLDAMLADNINKLSAIEGLLAKTLDHYDALLSALGDAKPMRYLVLNQNRDEIRASGGFPGTLFFAELYQGRVRKFEKFDVYDIDWKIAPYREAPPPALRELTDNFGLRDANYFIDFHETAKKVNFFFEKAGNESLDGVFAINQWIVEEFLRAYGSVHIPSLAMDVSDKNFSMLLSTVVEAKIQPYEQVGKDEFISPKSFLFEFSDELFRRLAAKRDFSGYFDIVSTNAHRGEILFSSIANASLDGLANAFELDGVWKRRDPAGDWIYSTFTSLSGNKSDRYVERDFAVSSAIDPTNAANCINTVALSSRHGFTAADEAEIKGLLASLKVPAERWDDIIRIQGNGRNRAYVRFAVPAGARFVDSTAAIATEWHEGLTIFSTTVDVLPSETKDLMLRYSLPRGVGESACTDATLLLQPGLRVK